MKDYLRLHTRYITRSAFPCNPGLECKESLRPWSLFTWNIRLNFLLPFLLNSPIRTILYYVTRFVTTVTSVRDHHTLSSMELATLSIRWPLLRCIYFIVSLNCWLHLPETPDFMLDTILTQRNEGTL